MSQNPNVVSVVFIIDSAVHGEKKMIFIHPETKKLDAYFSSSQVLEPFSLANMELVVERYVQHFLDQTDLCKPLRQPLFLLHSYNSRDRRQARLPGVQVRVRQRLLRTEEERRLDGVHHR